MALGFHGWGVAAQQHVTSLWYDNRSTSDLRWPVSQHDPRPIGTFGSTRSLPTVPLPISRSTAPAPPQPSIPAKRGVAYSDATSVTPFLDHNYISWAYNWAANPGTSLGRLQYIPTLWGDAASWTDSWFDDARAGIAAGARHLFSFNEPDLVSQANMSPEVAVGAWMTYMEPFAGEVAPSVSNSQRSGEGLEWLEEFLRLCGNCTIDAVNQHWYGNDDIDEFKLQIGGTIERAQKPVWVTEFASSGANDKAVLFLKAAMSWLDENSAVLGYAYFMAKDGILLNASALSELGKAYAGPD